MPAAEHIHLLIDGRNKFITRATSYTAVNELVMQRISGLCYFQEKPLEPEPVVKVQEPQLETEQALATPVEAASQPTPDEKTVRTPSTTLLNFLRIDVFSGI